MSISVLILTLNEEINIEACIASLQWASDIVVLDSYSTDETVNLARKAGARVFQRKFDNWAAHQNWAVKTIDFRNPWVLYLDADERCPNDLRDEILAKVRSDSAASAFRVRRKDYFMGRWLKHAQLYPTWFTRIFRPTAITYERLVNPVAVVSGSTEALDAHIDHFPFSHGVSHWIARHNRYSDFEAEEMLKVREGQRASPSELFSSDPVARRRALKDIYFRLPLRPFIKFCYYYFVRRGFLDGSAGLTYSKLQSIYEYMIDCKYRELLRRRKGEPL